MVEVFLVFVEAADGYRQEPPAFFVKLCVGVHNPFITRGGDGHSPGLAQIVDIECNTFIYVCPVGF